MTRPNPSGFSIRTITAGLTLESPDDLRPLDEAIEFLRSVRVEFEGAGYIVQSTRVATQPLGPLYRSLTGPKALKAFERLDRVATDADIDLSVGPLIEDDQMDASFPSWAADLVASTKRTYFSVAVASPRLHIHERTVQTAAETIVEVSRAEAGGEANFRFAAAAWIPASVPFFPVAYHAGTPAFTLGLESAGLVGEALAGSASIHAATVALQSLLEERLAPLEKLALATATKTSRRFAGLDLSPAPSLAASIAQAIEELIGRPFGSSSTLAACAAITRALDGVALQRCGYSGLMLPLLEDRILAQRAVENRYGSRDLLLYSSVCGTGLDVIPLPGDIEVRELSDLILDVASLASKWQKPLAARLLPIPGKSAGDRVEFANPHLTASVVLPPG